MFEIYVMILKNIYLKYKKKNKPGCVKNNMRKRMKLRDKTPQRSE